MAELSELTKEVVREVKSEMSLYAVAVQEYAKNPSDSMLNAVNEIEASLAKATNAALDKLGITDGKTKAQMELDITQLAFEVADVGKGTLDGTDTKIVLKNINKDVNAYQNAVTQFAQEPSNANL